MIRRIKNLKEVEKRKKEKKYQSLLENLIILLISKGVISQEDYNKLEKESK